MGNGFVDRKLPTSRSLRLSGLVAVLAFVGTVEDAVRAEEDRWAQPRAAMVSTIQAHAALLPDTVNAHGLSPAVLDVMGKVPRHRFVPERAEGRAYADAPLPSAMGRRSRNRSLSR